MVAAALLLSVRPATEGGSDGRRLGWTLAELLNAAPEQLAQVDIAVANLACAEGLPGFGHGAVEHLLKSLDDWALRVRDETDRHLYRASDPRFRDRYGGSEPRYRAEMLVQVLQEDFGVSYDATRVAQLNYRDSNDLFIHGLISRRHGGTCVSMPVLYTAIARRLGYPVKLVRAKAHLFCRWEGALPGGRLERFNFEGSGAGFSILDDVHYRSWPRPVSDAEVASGQFLASLSPSQELAEFLAARGHCLFDNGSLHEAHAAYLCAVRLDPVFEDYRRFAAAAAQAIERRVPATSDRR